MALQVTKRPRNIDAVHAGGVLYGALGTSKIYVIGLAFAIAGYASFWLIVAASLLTLLIGLNYIVVCKYYPNGGGVYASMRERSKIISLLGALFLVADYIITASLSALAAFHYLGVIQPALFAILAIVVIGVLNYWGPRRIGKFAYVIALSSVAVLVILFFFAIPHLKPGWEGIESLSGGFWKNWKDFMSVILLLSGIETVANMTSVMRLDKGATEESPKVTRTASKAILAAVFETAIFTSLFALVLSSVKGLNIFHGGLFAPDGQDIRDYVFRYLGQSFVGAEWGAKAGLYFGVITSVIFAILLISAVNTAINSMISLFYLMSEDGELPRSFTKLNSHGVPLFPYIIAILLPVFVLLFMHDIAKLAALYAVGFVGAITINLGATSTDRSLPLWKSERALLFVSFLIMLACETTLFVDKPHARLYVLVILFMGLLLRGLAREVSEKKKGLNLSNALQLNTPDMLEGDGGILCLISGEGKALALAKEKAKKDSLPLYFLFLKEQSVLTQADLKDDGRRDKEALETFHTLGTLSEGFATHFCYAVTDAPANTVVNLVKRLHIHDIIIDFPKKGILSQLLKGDIIRDIWPHLTDDIDCYIIPED